MSDLKIETGGWVIVCDGAKALILENAGDRAFPNLKTRQVFEQEDAMDRDLSADKPGRAFNSVDGSRSAVEQVDRHQQAEDRFLSKLAARLDKAVLDREAASLILVAPPRAIGHLRSVISKHVREAIKAEVEKDLVKMPVHEIERHLFS